jgi:hypothetical protein
LIEKEGYYWTDKDKETLKKMFKELNWERTRYRVRINRFCNNM